MHRSQVWWQEPDAGWEAILSAVGSWILKQEGSKKVTNRNKQRRKWKRAMPQNQVNFEALVIKNRPLTGKVYYYLMQILRFFFFFSFLRSSGESGHKDICMNVYCSIQGYV